MYTGVVVSIVREIVVGIASYVSQFIVMMVNCWVTDCKNSKKSSKNHVDTTTMASSVATPSPIWTVPPTVIPSLTSYDAVYHLVSF